MTDSRAGIERRHRMLTAGPQVLARQLLLRLRSAMRRASTWLSPRTAVFTGKARHLAGRSDLLNRLALLSRLNSYDRTRLNKKSDSRTGFHGSELVRASSQDTSAARSYAPLFSETP